MVSFFTWPAPTPNTQHPTPTDGSAFDTKVKMQFREGSSYVVFGIINTSLAYCIFVSLCFFFVEWQYLTTLVASYFLSSFISFASQKYFVFKGKGQLVGEFLRFHLSGIAGLGFNCVALAFFVEILDLRVIIAQAVATIFTVPGVFLLHKYFSFGKRFLRTERRQ